MGACNRLKISFFEKFLFRHYEIEKRKVVSFFGADLALVDKLGCFGEDS